MIYSGVRLNAEEIVSSAVEENVDDIIGASVLSGSHMEFAEQDMGGLREHGVRERIKVVFGDITPSLTTRCNRSRATKCSS